jgi:AcrR family transcriptional regulator
MTQTKALPIPVDQEHRSRVLEGMARAVAAKGYAETTIADVVREARVSRRTFYEYFSSKAECLIALYEAASHNALDVLRSSIDPNLTWEMQVEKAITAYFQCLALNPVLLRTLFVDILGLGQEGLAARRRVNDAIAAFMVQAINTDGRHTGHKQPLSPELAVAAVGGINELILQAIERERPGDLLKLAGPAIQLVKAIT